MQASAPSASATITPALSTIAAARTSNSGAAPETHPHDTSAGSTDDKPLKPAASGPQSSSWVTKLSLDDLSVLYKDMIAVAEYVRSSLLEKMLDLMVALPEEARSAAQAALRQLSDAIESQAGDLLDEMCEEVVDTCAPMVKQLRGITATYRMTSKGPPVRHSHYVNSILAPLR